MNTTTTPYRVLTFVAAMLVGFVAQATIHDHSPALIRLLSAIDIVPTPGQIAEATGDTPEDELFAVAVDATLAEHLRSRATSVMSMFPNKRSAVYLEDLASSVGILSIRWMATYTRIRAFADTEALRFAGNTLDSPVTRLRHACVRALRWIPGKAATELLSKQLARESDERLRKTIRRMIRLRRR